MQRTCIEPRIMKNMWVKSNIVKGTSVESGSRITYIAGAGLYRKVTAKSKLSM